VVPDGANPRAGRENAIPGCVSDLTARQRQVLRWVGLGKSNFEIGAILGLSALTVKKHLENVYSRLGVCSRAAAVAAVLEHDH
jgi:DNA-binding CsgD family transcriptional regulator